MKKLISVLLLLTMVLSGVTAVPVMAKEKHIVKGISGMAGSEEVDILAYEGAHLSVRKDISAPPVRKEIRPDFGENKDKVEVLEGFSYDADISLNAHFDENKNFVVDFNGSNNTAEELYYFVFISVFDDKDDFCAYSYYGDYFIGFERNYTGGCEYSIGSDFFPKNTAYKIKVAVIKADYDAVSDEYSFDSIVPLTKPLIANIDLSNNITISGYHTTTETTETTTETTETTTITDITTETTTSSVTGDYIKKLSSSYYPESNVEFYITSDNKVGIKAIETNTDITEVLCWFDDNDITYNDVYAKDEDNKFDFALDTSSLSNGTHSVNYYINNDRGSYTSYITDVEILKNSDGVSIIIPYKIYKENMEVLNEDAEKYDPTFYLTSKDYWLTEKDKNPEDYAEIKAKALEVTQKASTDYEKLLAIHNFVATTVYYDYDYYYGKNSSTYIKDIDVLHNGYSVCHGYSSLFVSMARTLGIPARIVTGYTKNGYASWEDRLKNPESDHAWVEAYANGRWIIIDATWDSPFKKGYETTGELTGSKSDLSLRYFDITSEMFAFDHKLEGYEIYE